MPELHGCKRCPAAVAWKPREAFEQPGVNGRKRLDTVCLECRAKEAAERAAREAAREARAATIVIGLRGLQSMCRPALPALLPGTVWRRCTCATHEGGPWAPLHTFPPTCYRGKRAYGYHCHRCTARRMTARDKAMRRDPQTAEAWRAKKTATSREWRRKNPEANREAHRRYMDSVRADPARHAAHLSNARILHRLRRLDRGLPVREHGQQTAIGAYRLSAGNTLDLYAVEPLALWVNTAMARDGRDHLELAALFGVADRALRRVQNREYEHVTLGVADKMLWAYGKAIRIPESAVEARLAEMAEHWQSAPGNGERLIGYLTDAERIAHLAGAVITRVEDLWLDLA